MACLGSCTDWRDTNFCCLSPVVKVQTTLQTSGNTLGFVPTIVRLLRSLSIAHSIVTG